MGRSATTLRPAHAHTNAPRLINPWQPKTAAAAADAASRGDDDDATGGGRVRPTPGEAGRGRPIAGKGTKSVGALWDLVQDAQKWAPPLVMASGVGKKTAFQKLPDVAATLECARAVALDRLRKKLNAAAIAAGAGAPPPQAFERWRFAATVEGNDASSDNGIVADPAVPCSVADGDGSALAALAADLTRAGVPADAAREAARATAEASRAEASNLRKLADRLATRVVGAPAKEKKKSGGDENAADAGVRLARVSVVFRKRSVELSSDKGKHFVVLSRNAYGKLAAMYRHVASAAPQSGLEALNAPETGSRSFGEKHSGDSDSDSDSDSGESDADDTRKNGESKTTFAVEEAETRAGETDVNSKDSVSSRDAFHSRLFALLLRYKSIQGYGFQSGVGPRVFATLRDTVGVTFEAFASPLNCFHTKGFCSAFPDVDAPFGSRGDFFKAAERKTFRRGAIQVNPPFVGGVMTRAAEAIENALVDADTHDAPLSFVVFVPGWTDEKAWNALTGSRFLKNTFVVAAADHGYCDGAAHQRKASFRSSTYDTGVFALCSRKAEATIAGKRFVAKNGASFEADVREALAGARMSDAAAVKKTVGGRLRKRGRGAAGRRTRRRRRTAAFSEERRRRRRRRTRRRRSGASAERRRRGRTRRRRRKPGTRRENIVSSVRMSMLRDGFLVTHTQKNKHALRARGPPRKPRLRRSTTSSPETTHAVR
jgi:phosphorylated CTD-interacting factor 1